MARIEGREDASTTNFVTTTTSHTTAQPTSSSPEMVPSCDLLSHKNGHSMSPAKNSSYVPFLSLWDQGGQ